MRISIHAPRKGERPLTLRELRIIAKFQSTLPARGSDFITSISHGSSTISIHAPRKGERLFTTAAVPAIKQYFNPRSPQGGATLPCGKPVSLCGYFNPRSPQGGATDKRRTAPLQRLRFQSTLPARGSDSGGTSLGSMFEISIHAPRKGERPMCTRADHRAAYYFNPRSPQGGATHCKPRLLSGCCISIHAPRKGERLPVSHCIGYADYISIHAPRKGERPDTGLGSAQPIRFQSTLPARGSDAQRRGQSRR